MNAHPTPRILVVEDDEPMRKMVAATVRSMGYEVVTATDGADAVAISERSSERIDLLITDVVMPGMHGPHLARLLALGRPDLKFLYISGYGREQIRGFDRATPFLEKPFSTAALRQKLAETLGLELDNPEPEPAVPHPSGEQAGDGAPQ